MKLEDFRDRLRKGIQARPKGEELSARDFLKMVSPEMTEHQLDLATSIMEALEQDEMKIVWGALSPSERSTLRGLPCDVDGCRTAPEWKASVHTPKLTLVQKSCQKHATDEHHREAFVRALKKVAKR